MRNVDHNFEEKISGLLSTLKRVEAPGDFDFKVRARIAQGRPSAARAFWLPASVKAAVPLGLVLSVGGYFGFNALYSTESIGPAIAIAPVEQLQPLPFVPVTEGPVAAPASPIAQSAEVAEVNPPRTSDIRKPVTAAIKRISTVRRAPESEGGSVDSAARETKSIFPVGVAPNSNVPIPAPSGESAPVVRISGKDVLDRIGVSAVFAAGYWRVSSVNSGGSAGKAGLQAGDLIEAVKGSALSDKAVIEPGFSARALRVRRDGRIVFIGLIP